MHQWQMLVEFVAASPVELTMSPSSRDASVDQTKGEQRSMKILNRLRDYVQSLFDSDYPPVHHPDLVEYDFNTCIVYRHVLSA